MQYMNDRVQNQINMINACITVAHTEANTLVWSDHEPADFALDLDALESDFADANSITTNIKDAIAGAGGVKGVARTAAEDAGYILAQALSNHFRKTDDLTNLAKVKVTKRGIQKLRDQDLVATLTDIRDLGGLAATQTGAAGRGVTAARLAKATTTLNRFKSLLSAPRRQVADRGALLRELKPCVAGMIEKLNGLDELVIQFDTTPEGRRFIDAWKIARVVVDAGHGPGEDEEPTPPTA